MAFKPDGTWEPENDSVATKVTGLMSSGNPLIQQARTEGLKQANARGLANSSIAIGAAEDAAYKTALPIASQDAQQTYGKNTTQMQLASNEKLSAAENANRLDVQNLSNASDERKTAATLASQEKQQAGINATQAAANYASIFSALAGNSDLPAATRDQYMAQATKLRDDNLSLLEQIYNVDLSWSTSGTPAGSGAAPAVPATFPLNTNTFRSIY